MISLSHSIGSELFFSFCSVHLDERQTTYLVAVLPKVRYSLILLFIGSKRCGYACTGANPHLLDPMNKRMRAREWKFAQNSYQVIIAYGLPASCWLACWHLEKKNKRWVSTNVSTQHPRIWRCPSRTKRWSSVFHFVPQLTKWKTELNFLFWRDTLQNNYGSVAI